MNRLKITFLLTCLTLLLVAMGSAIGGQSGMLIAFALACGMLGDLAMAFIAPMVAMLIQMAVSRSREYLADASGARICGYPLAQVNALRKLQMGAQAVPMTEVAPATAHMFIVNPLTGASMPKLFSTHPPMDE